VFGRTNDGQTLIAGMGELHLEVLVDRMLREFRVSADVGGRAWLTRDDYAPVRAEGKFIRQTGGHGQYGTPSSSLSDGKGQGL